MHEPPLLDGPAVAEGRSKLLRRGIDILSKEGLKPADPPEKGRADFRLGIEPSSDCRCLLGFGWP